MLDIEKIVRIVANVERPTQQQPLSKSTSELELAYPIPSLEQPFSYRIMGIDGSQIYPDRHEGVPWYLLNIATTFFDYGPLESTVLFHTEPTVHWGLTDEGTFMKPAAIDGQRNRAELKAALTHAQRFQPDLILFDGTLSRDALYDSLDQLKIPYMGYISQPTRVLTRELPVGWRTAIEQSRIEQSRIEQSRIDQSSCPQFPYFYYHAGSEIARIEIPRWLLSDTERIDYCTQLVADQVSKGLGYPIALSEAHEQAVVSYRDRDFLYQLLRNNGHVENRCSPKLWSKRTKSW